MAAAFASASAAESSAVRMLGNNALTMASTNTPHGSRRSKKRGLDDEYSDEMAFPESRSQAKRAAGSHLMMSSQTGAAASAASQLQGFALGAARKRDASWRDSNPAAFDENAKRNRSTGWQATAPQMVTVNKHQLEMHEGQYKAEIERLKQQLASQRQEALSRIGTLEHSLQQTQQRADGLQKLLEASAGASSRMKQEHGLLKRAVEVHNQRNQEAQRTIEEQGQKIGQLTQLAENLYQSNQSLMARLAALDNGGISSMGDQHYPHWGDSR